MLCFRAWEDWAVYPNDYLINLQNIFLGLVPKEVSGKSRRTFNIGRKFLHAEYWPDFITLAPISTIPPPR